MNAYAISIPSLALGLLGKGDPLHLYLWLTQIQQIEGPGRWLAESDLRSLWPYDRTWKWVLKQLREMEPMGLVQQKKDPAAWRVPHVQEEVDVLSLEALAEVFGGPRAVLTGPLQDRMLKALESRGRAAPSGKTPVPDMVSGDGGKTWAPGEIEEITPLPPAFPSGDPLFALLLESGPLSVRVRVRRVDEEQKSAVWGQVVLGSCEVEEQVLLFRGGPAEVDRWLALVGPAAPGSPAPAPPAVAEEVTRHLYDPDTGTRCGVRPETALGVTGNRARVTCTACLESAADGHPGPRLVHVLCLGQTLCGAHPGKVPRDWPPGEAWAPWEHRDKATCPECKAAPKPQSFEDLAKQILEGGQNG